ncbi:MAG: hypothetical protein GY774_37950 [Planctomycetes bacterium]|nr:hypothetical protein [Planctomycetota bacterium]
MRKVVGAIFCCIAAILYVSNYLAAVIYMPHIRNFSTPPGHMGTAYKIVGRTPGYLACIALVVGIVYLVIGELIQTKSKKKS